MASTAAPDGPGPVAFIGFGEVATCFARDLLTAGFTRITAFDPVPGRAASLPGVRACATPHEAVRGAALVFVAVTAGSALAAMHALSGSLGHAPLVVDVNSVSPRTKQQSEAAIEGAGGRYVEAAVMTSVPPHGIRSPMLLGGRHTGDFIAFGAGLGMKLTAFSDRVGPASSVKMCRSVMIKGMEALFSDCLLTARHYGVEDDVLASLQDTLPGTEARVLGRYMMGRALVHGRRRAEEVREVAETVRDAGFEPLMSTAIARRQDLAADQGLALGKDGLAALDLPALLDAILDLQARAAAAD